MTSPTAIDLYGDQSFNIKVYSPPTGKPKKVVLICGALGVHSSFYQPIAQWLASRQCLAITFDHRGMGTNQRPGQPLGDISVRTWLNEDLAAIISWLRTHYTQYRISCLGHSFGGVSLGACPAVNEVERLILVSPLSGYLNHFRLKTRLLLNTYRLLVPLVVPLLGYFHFPGNKTIHHEHIPPKVIRSWARWLTSPDFIKSDSELDVANYQQFHGSLIAFAFDDDKRSPLDAVIAATRYYPRARYSTILKVSPQAHGMEKIGHYNMFSDTASHSLWPLIYETL